MAINDKIVYRSRAPHISRMQDLFYHIYVLHYQVRKTGSLKIAAYHNCEIAVG
jgi:hypothetical protein